MQETEPAMYNVSVDEVVDIRVTPIGTAVFVAASVDGGTLAPLSGSNNAPHYRFVARGPVGTDHVLGMEFSFPGAKKGSRYDVAICGSDGGSASFTIGVNNAIKDPFLTFTVV